jgi:hypothetical protein
MSTSAQEVIERFKALPPQDRADVARFIAEHDDSWVPESFKRGMADTEAGRFAEMETVLSGAPPPSRRRAK